MQEFLEFAHDLVTCPGQMIRDRFLKRDWDVSLKDDRSVVTEVDRQAEEMIRSQIKKRYPDHGIIAEEFGNENEEAEFVWVIDPIDGTISFISGVPLFGTLVGLLHQGKPVVGSIYQPVLDLCCLGDNHSTTLNGTPTSVRQRPLAESTLLITDPLLVPQYQDQEGYNALCNEVSQMRTWGDCYGYLMIASGQADLMLDPIVNPWDILPIIPIIRGAGGRITAWDGGEPDSPTSAVAGSSDIHTQAISLLNR